MRSWVLAACLLAAAATPALAADLGDGSDRHDGRPSYGDNDDDGDDGHHERSGRRHSRGDGHSSDDDDVDDDHDNNGHHERSGRRHSRGDGHSFDHGKYHAGAHRPYGRTCTRSEDVRNHLIDLGWRDFHASHPWAAEVVTLRARRSDGRLFELTLERCSGRLVYARPLERRPLRSFAPGEFGPGRWDRYESADPWFRRPYASHRPRHRDRED